MLVKIAIELLELLTTIKMEKFFSNVVPSWTARKLLGEATDSKDTVPSGLSFR